MAVKNANTTIQPMNRRVGSVGGIPFRLPGILVVEDIKSDQKGGIMSDYHCRGQSCIHQIHTSHIRSSGYANRARERLWVRTAFEVPQARS